MKRVMLLSNRLFLIMLALVGISCLALGGGSWLLFSRTIEEDLESKARSVASLAALNLTNPLYSTDIDKIRSVASNILELPDMKSVTVLDAEGKILSDGTRENTRLFEVYPLPQTWAADAETLVADSGDTLVFSGKIRLAEQLLGHLILEYSKAATMARLRVFYGVFAVVLLLSLSLAFVGRIVLKRAIGPLTDVVRATENLTAGEVDLDVHIRVAREDEIGAVAANFNNFIGRLDSTVGHIRRAVSSLQASGSSLGSAMSQNSTAVRNMTSSIEEAKGHSVAQSAAITEVSSAMEQITRNIESLFRLVEGHASAVSESSASIEEMIASIQSVAKGVDASVTQINRLVASSEDGHARIAEVSELVKDIAGRSRTLTEANGIVKSLASRTNLLAMNAAIEAAHAGDAGKGFAVVADEIRSLAESSARQSKEISSNITVITGKVDSVVASTDRAGKAFDEIRAGIKEVDAVETGIRNAMAEQAQGGKEVLKALAQMNDMTSEIKGAAGEMKTGSALVANELRELLTATEKAKDSMAQIVAGIAEVEAATAASSRFAGENSHAAEEVSHEVGRFKTRNASTQDA